MIMINISLVQRNTEYSKWGLCNLTDKQLRRALRRLRKCLPGHRKALSGMHVLSAIINVELYGFAGWRRDRIREVWNVSTVMRLGDNENIR